MVKNANEYMKYHIFELRRKRWRHDWSSQLCTQLQQLEIKARKENSGLKGIRTHDLFDTGAVINHVFIPFPVVQIYAPESQRSWVRIIPFKSDLFIYLFIFRLQFHNCWSCVYSCDDQSCLHFFLRGSNIWYFIHSFARFTCLTLN